MFLSIELLFETTPILQKFLRRFLIVPEILRRRFLFDIA